MSYFVSVDELLGGGILGTESVLLPPYSTAARVVIPVAGGTVDVFARGTTTHADCFTDPHGGGTAVVQPLTTDQDGRVTDPSGALVYTAQPAELDVRVSGPGLSATRTIPVGSLADSGSGGVALTKAAVVATGLGPGDIGAAAAADLTAEVSRAEAAEAAKTPALVASAVLDAASSPIAAVPNVLYSIDLTQGNVQLNLPAGPADRDQVAWKVVKTTVQTGLSGALSVSGAIAALPVMALEKPIAAGQTVVVAAPTGQSQQWTLAAPAAQGDVSLTVNSQTPNFAYPQGSQVTFMPLNTSLTISVAGGQAFDIPGGAVSATAAMQGQARTVQYAAAETVWIVRSADNPLSQLDQRYYHVSSWVDMCAQPYNCRPGADASAAVQRALNYMNGVNQDTTIYFSQQGTYTWTGAIQSGVSATTPAQPYAGQVLIPPRKYAAGSISVRFKGVNPPALFSAAAGSTLEPAPATGTVLQSTAVGAYCSTTTSGAITAGVNTTTIAVNATPQIIPKGATVQLVSGTSAQLWVTSGQVAAGAVSIPVYGQPAAFTSAAGATVKYGAWMIDAIAGDYFGAGTPSTNFRLCLEDIVFRAPNNPDIGGVNGNQLACTQTRGNVSIETGLVGGNNVGNITGCGVGIQFGPFDNIAMQSQSGVMQVLGFACGVVHAEHFACDYLYVGMCLHGIQPQALGGTGHHAIYKKLLIQGCWNGICAIGQGNISVDGHIDVDDGAGGYYQKINYVVNDPNSVLFGELTVMQYGNAGVTGFPVLGAQNVRWVPQNGPRSLFPWDDFQRMLFTAAGVTYLGVSSSHHTWQLKGSNAVQTSFNAGGGALKSTTNAASVVPLAVCQYRTGRPSPSRTLRMIVTPTAPYFVFLCAGYAGNQNSWQIVLNGTSNRIELQKVLTGSGTIVAQSAVGVVTSGATYTFDVEIRNPPQGPYVITPTLNGVPVLITATGAGQLEQQVAVLTAATGTAAITTLTVAPLGRPIPTGATVTVYQGASVLTATTSGPVAAGAVTIPINSITPAVSFLPGCLVTAPTGGYMVAPAEVGQVADAAGATTTSDGLGFWKDNTSSVAAFSAVPMGG